MDIPQLKLLAARIRELLKQSSCIVGHSQSLDLVAALPGLRNWPEVNAFPERVAACQLDLSATSRLAFRLSKKFDLNRSAQQLLEELRLVLGTNSVTSALEVWPGGPPAGVYLTTSEEAIKALLERYEDATDGAVVYAEHVGTHHPGSIDLGEYGLWSNGLDRVPSGTLLVLGPIEVDQARWEDAGKRLLAACLRASLEQHRVAVLIETPTPETIFEDARILVRSASEEPEDRIDAEIVGVVEENGDLTTLSIPAYAPHQRPPNIPTTATLDALPPETIEPLRRALTNRTAGLLLFGSSEITEHTAIEQVAAALVLTDHAGPAARIMPRHRSTPEKDWWVPEPIKSLPFLPSIQSAYAQGYRRMVISPHYTDAETVLDHPDVLFIGGTHGSEVKEVARLVFGIGRAEPAELAARLIASLGLLHVPTKHGVTIAADLVVMPRVPPPADMRYKELEAFLLQHRLLRWEDVVERLLSTRACSTAELKKALPHDRHIASFLAQRRKATAKAS